MWSHARYNLRMSERAFWRLTPRTYDLMCKRHREDLAHREMVAAFTTAAVINHSFAPPEKGVAPLDFMPNYRPDAPPKAAPASPQQKAAMEAFDSKVVAMTAEVKAMAATGVVGPMLRALGYGDGGEQLG